MQVQYLSPGYDAVALIESVSSAKQIALISDENTYMALGTALEAQLQKARNITLIKLGKRIKPEIAIVEQLRQKTAACKLLLAVGSGTINDLCKYTAHLEGKPYCSFPTAPSMNGYASANASIINDAGRKTTLLASQPLAIFCDMEVLAKAPKRLTRAGLGDSLCRPTAQADWLLSHLLLGTPYDTAPFDMLAPYEKELFDNSQRLVEGDKAITELLMRTLIASGEGMTLAGGSYPASQGEHMIAHTMEMLYGSSLHPTYHGEDIGVTTVTMAMIQEKLLLERPTIQPSKLSQERCEQIFGKKLGAECFAEYQRKAISEEQAQALNDKLADAWPAMREQIEAVTIRSSKLELILRMAHAPASPADIHWNKDRYENAVTNAYLTRNRFTFLDLAGMVQRRYWFAQESKAAIRDREKKQLRDRESKAPSAARPSDKTRR